MPPLKQPSEVLNHNHKFVLKHINRVGAANVPSIDKIMQDTRLVWKLINELRAMNLIMPTSRGLKLTYTGKREIKRILDEEAKPPPPIPWRKPKVRAKVEQTKIAKVESKGAFCERCGAALWLKGGCVCG